MLTSGDIEIARFTTTQGRRGYDERSVDQLLVAVHATLRAYEAGHTPDDPLSADDVERARFTTTHYRRGYDQHEVDDYLDEVAATLRAHESDAPAGREGILAGAGAVPQHPVPGAAHTATHSTARPAASRPESLGRRLIRILRGEPPPL